MDLVEQKLLELLQSSIISNSQTINTIVAEALTELKNSDFVSVTKNIPIKKFFTNLPEEIKLCRIFGLKANTKSKIERHPNSFQRTFTYVGRGDTKILENDVWKPNIKNSLGKSISERWLSIPEGIWHQPIALNDNWVTITFHTAGELEIIDEYEKEG